MISELATDILNKVKNGTSTSFGNPKRVGMASGGKNLDPLMTKSIRPACWIVFLNDQNVDAQDNQGSCGSMFKYTFVVKILLDYSTEEDLLTNQLPVLEAVQLAVNGQQGPIGSRKWLYEGQTIDELSANRMVYDQTYTIYAIA